jgi:hypothetical protein
LTPVDFALDVNSKRKEIPVSKLPTENSIMDIGAKTVENYAKIIADAKSIVVEKNQKNFREKNVPKQAIFMIPTVEPSFKSKNNQKKIIY